MRVGALLCLLCVACGAVDVTTDAGQHRDAARGASDGAAEITNVDLGGSRDAGVDKCPPTPALECSGLPGACPQGQAQGRHSVCGGAPVAVCCPVNDCELALCDVCPLCVP